MGHTSRLVRINKFIADSGVASRRKADELIFEGVVRVNGKTVEEPGIQIDPATAEVTVRGRRITLPRDKKYFVFHKPRQVITSLSDPEGRPTVGDYFRKHRLRLFPVGRLDWNTEGLLLMTNDGDFAQRVIHPKFGIVKTYVARLDGVPTDAQLERLLRGITIPDGRVKAVAVKRMQKQSEKYNWIQISIVEGKNQQVRKMFEKIGYSVTRLKRVSIGGLRLGTLRTGEIRELTHLEAKRALKSVAAPESKT